MADGLNETEFFGRNDGQEHDALSAASSSAAADSAEAAVETVGVTSADGGRFKRNGGLWTKRRAGARRVICRVRLRRRSRRRALCRGLSPEECGSGGEFNPGWSGWGVFRKRYRPRPARKRGIPARKGRAGGVFRKRYRPRPARKRGIPAREGRAGENCGSVIGRVRLRRLGRRHHRRGLHRSRRRNGCRRRSRRWNGCRRSCRRNGR